jgi:hypothetical protein
MVASCKVASCTGIDIADHGYRTKCPPMDFGGRNVYAAYLFLDIVGRSV